MATRRSILRAAGAATAVVALVATVGACGDDDGPSAERFCGEIEANLDTLTDPDLAFVEDVEPLLELYREIAELAPLSIEAEWRQLVTNYETASTIVPGDDESEQRVVEMAYQSERSAARVGEWLIANCALSLGPISTIVPQN